MSTPLQKLIEKKNKQKLVDNLDVKQFIILQAEELTTKMLADLKPQILENVSNTLEETINDLVSNVKKGDKGDKPVAGIDYKIPEDGKNYILTESDKKEISSKIKVPVVEKVEIIKEQPIITNEIKEVAKFETVDQIANKLNTKEDIIEQKTIKGLSNIISNLQRAIKEKTVKQMGGGGFSDVNFVESETPTGTVNGVNTDFVLSSTPTPSTSLKVFVNGQRFKITEDYTLSGTTITFVTAPPTSSIILCDYRK